MWTIILFTQFLIAIFGLLGDPFIGAMDGNGLNGEQLQFINSNKANFTFFKSLHRKQAEIHSLQ
jgi:hypothetical protein